MKERNPNIELLRVVFMIVICLWHFRGVAPSFNNGYIAVEFFFIVSGFLLYNSYCNHPEISTYNYILKKIKVFYPAYIIMFFPTMIIRWREWIPSDYNLDGIVSVFNVVIRDIFLLGGLEIYGGIPLNPPLWYITILLVGSYFLYTLLKIVGKYTIHICSILVVLLYIYLFDVSNSLDCFSGIRFHEIIRGIAGMSLGVLLSYIAVYKNLRKSNRFVFISMTLIALFYCYSSVHYDCYAILVFSILILSSLTKYDYHPFLEQIIIRLGGITYEMLCVHIAINQSFAYIAKTIVLPNYLNIIIYLVLVITFAVFLHKLVIAFRKKFVWFQL